MLKLLMLFFLVSLITMLFVAAFIKRGACPMRAVHKPKEHAWKSGDKVVCNGNREAIVLKETENGMYEVRLYDGNRYVGDVCVDGDELVSV